MARDCSRGPSPWGTNLASTARPWFSGAVAGTKITAEGLATLRANTLLTASSSVLTSLEGVDVSAIADGSSCYVEDQDRVYRYYESAVGPQSLPFVLGANGPGFWVQNGGLSPLPWPGSLSCGPLISGAVRDILPAAALFPVSIIWYLNAARLIKLLELTLTRNGSQQVTQEQWKVYDTNGVLTLTVTDVITYSGIYEVSRTRTVV